MTFEEFFKKKKINLAALQQSEPALFAEFKTHYEQMGEKSFDHTKKYWFNKLRRQFVPLVEIKTEKVNIENPIAEQIVTEALIEEGATPAPPLGFKPKFSAAALPKPVAESKDDAPVPDKIIAEEKPVEDVPKPALGFKPKFRAVNAPKPVSEVKGEAISPDKEAVEEKPAEGIAKPILGFKPKFKAANVPKPAVENMPVAENAAEPIVPQNEIKTELPIVENTPPKLGFKPKFQAPVTPKPAEEDKTGDSE